MCVHINAIARKALLKSHRKPKGNPDPKRGAKRGLRRNPKLNLEKAYPSDQKERGEWVELLFMANAARMGLRVSRPHGDSARFDVIVEGGGKLHRVQVKSTTYGRNGFHKCLYFWSGTKLRLTPARDGNPAALVTRGQAKKYSTEQIDFVAAYVVPEDAWFIIPAGEIRAKSFNLPPREQPERNRYGQFLEAWALLGADGSRLTIHASVESDLLLTLIKAKVAEELQRRSAS